MAEANAEFAGARNIDIYGLKKEGSTPILWIKDSADINLFGASGGYTAMQTSDQVLPCLWQQAALRPGCVAR